MVNLRCLKRADPATVDRVIEADVVDEKLRKKDHDRKRSLRNDLSHFEIGKGLRLMEKGMLC